MTIKEALLELDSLKEHCESMKEHKHHEPWDSDVEAIEMAMKALVEKLSCSACRHCEEWEGHKGFYCSNENAVKYLTDVDEKNETCEKWEAENGRT